MTSRHLCWAGAVSTRSCYAMGVKILLTGSEARSPTKRPPRPKVAMHDARPHQFQEQVQRVLEFVVHARSLDRDIHRACQGRVRVGIQEESACKPRPKRTVVRSLLRGCAECAQSACLPSEFQETPDDICHKLVLFLQGRRSLARLNFRTRCKLVGDRRTEAQREIDRGRLL